ncbi:MAG: AAA family ATPase [Nitrospirae bacterium]|nr:AAA family ATPase [Nitrospirota bacterium]
MKLLRLKVVNYRGINTREVKFSPMGITRIEGPNESGKSSLGEAINTILDYPDNSKKQDILAIQPVHQDVGPEIELELETGKYVFTYFKRFLKKPETRFTITKPNPENFTGRQAHDRANEILKETLDVDLWKAVSILQGEAIGQPDLKNKQALSAALDKAAGVHPAAPQEISLFKRVSQEYELYYTIGRGTEKKELQDLRNTLAEKQTEVRSIEQAIRELETDIDRVPVLQRELAQLKKQEEELSQQLIDLTAKLEQISLLENTLSAAALKQEVAQKTLQAAQHAKEIRQEIISAVENAAKVHRDLQESSAMALPALSQAQDALKKARAAADEAERKRKEAESLAALKRADFDYYHDKLDLDQLFERKQRIDQARKDAAEAEIALAKNKVDALALDGIKEAELGYKTACARMEIGSPSVLLRSISKCRLSIDGTEAVLDTNEVRKISVSDKTTVSIPGTLDIEITAGSSIEGLARKVEDARQTLQAACAAATVADPDEARKAYDERQEALRVVENKDRVEKENLRDITYESVEQRLHNLQQSVPNYLAGRVKDPAICPDFDTAKKEWTKAEANLQAAKSEWESRRKVFVSAGSFYEGENLKHSVAVAKLEQLAKDLKQTQENLDKGRKEKSDETLEADLTSADRAVLSEDTAYRLATASLEACNPEQARALVESAKGSLKTIKTSYESKDKVLTEVQTRLKIMGEEGLHEKLNAAENQLEQLEFKNRAITRRANAAKCLFDTMCEERDKASRAYVAPLKDRIERLGRLVFDPSFQVTIDDGLKITSRTVSGVTVPFDSLSGGTREQLSLMYRLSCSMIVAKDGGTPVILDDALGYTDPERLKLMGAVLAVAARECQIVIFTCVPERYAFIGEAAVVPL